MENDPQYCILCALATLTPTQAQTQLIHFRDKGGGGFDFPPVCCGQYHCLTLSHYIHPAKYVNSEIVNRMLKFTFPQQKTHSW